MKKPKLSIEDRVISLEAAYAAAGLNIEKDRPFPNPVNDHQEYLNACMDDRAIVLAFNEGKRAKYGIWGYVPVFRKPDHPSGFGFACVDGAWSYSSSAVGSRAFVKSEHAELAGKRFESVYLALHK